MQTKKETEEKDRLGRNVRRGQKQGRERIKTDTDGESKKNRKERQRKKRRSKCREE